MTETETTTAMAFVATLAEYRIAISETEAHQITKDVGKWREAMRWINAIESFLSFGNILTQPPSSLRRFLNGDQLAGKRESFLPVKAAPKLLLEQRGFKFL